MSRNTAISKKMKNGFAMMSGSDEPLGACHSIIIDEQVPRCWLIAIHHPFRAYIIANRKSSRKILKNICLNIFFLLLKRKKSLWKGGAAAPELRAVVSLLWMPAFPADCRHLPAPSSMASFPQDKKSSLRKKKGWRQKNLRTQNKGISLTLMTV